MVLSTDSEFDHFMAGNWSNGMQLVLNPLLQKVNGEMKPLAGNPFVPLDVLLMRASHGTA
jgi:hypothetical protein